MNRFTVVLFAVLFTVAAVAHAAHATGRALWITQAGAPRAASSIGPGSASAPRLDRHGPPTKPDLFGNDINDAIARYRSDPAGVVYEEHSPQTEVPFLPPPKT